MRGKLVLVGAGPGAPDLITIRGLRELKAANVVLYDRLASPDLLKECSQDAEIIDVGKVPGEDQNARQAAIHELIVSRARAGKTVVRLKGGDPFVFGRGGEEWLAAAGAGIPVEVIPGISSAIAAPESAGIPVTHRGISNAFAVFTGHEADSGNGIPWGAAVEMPTSIFLMGVERLPWIVEKLLSCGAPPNRPVAIVSKGTMPDQSMIKGTLDSIVGLAKEVVSPAVVIVGEVIDALAGDRR